MKQLENTLQDLKCMLIEDGYKDDNIVIITLIKAATTIFLISTTTLLIWMAHKRALQFYKEELEKEVPLIILSKLIMKILYNRQIVYYKIHQEK
jgi:hypothetical protein